MFQQKGQASLVNKFKARSSSEWQSLCLSIEIAPVKPHIPLLFFKDRPNDVAVSIKAFPWNDYVQDLPTSRRQVSQGIMYDTITYHLVQFLQAASARTRKRTRSYV